MSVSTTIVLAGQYLNSLARALSVTTFPSAANPLFPLANLYNDWPGIEFRFADAAADQRIVADLALWDGGGFEAPGGSLAADGWTNSSYGGGNAAKSTAQHHGSGAQSVLLTPGAGTAQVQRSKEVRAGEVLVLDGFVYSATAAQAANFYVRNLQTGHYLRPNGIWQTLMVPCANGTAGPAWTGIVGGSFAFAVESHAACLGPTATLQVTAEAPAGAAPIFFDNVNLWPAHTFASVHGHNIDPAIVATVAVSDDNIAYSTAATFTKYPRSFYASYSQQTKRYAMLMLGGTNSAPIRIGEAVLGQGLQLTTGCRFPVPMKYRTRQDAAHGFVYSLDDDPPRSVRLDFKHLSAASYVQYRDEVELRAMGARWPVVVVPIPAARPDLVLFGRSAMTWEDQYGPGQTIYRTVMDLDEAPFAPKG